MRRAARIFPVRRLRGDGEEPCRAGETGPPRGSRARVDRARGGGVADRRRPAGYSGGAGQPDSGDFGENGPYTRRGTGAVAAGLALARLARVPVAYGGINIRDECGLIGYSVVCCSVVASGRSNM